MNEYQELLEKIGAKSHEDALREIARLKERSAILAMLMERLNVKAHWEVPAAFNKLFRNQHKKTDS
jgi:hypothetical protein